MNYPRASCGVSKNIYESFPEVVTPECLIGVQSKFRLDSCYKHAGMTDFEGTRNPVCAASWRGVDPMRLFFFRPAAGTQPRRF